MGINDSNQLAVQLAQTQGFQNMLHYISFFFIYTKQTNNYMCKHEDLNVLLYFKLEFYIEEKNGRFCQNKDHMALKSWII